MAKFEVTMYYTVCYSHTETIEANTKGEAEEKAQRIFENADCQEDWRISDGDLEMDVFKIPEE